MVGCLDIWLFGPFDSRLDYFAHSDAACLIFGSFDTWSLVGRFDAHFDAFACSDAACFNHTLIVRMFACLIIWLFGPFDARLDHFARWDAAQCDVACLRHLVIWMLGCPATSTAPLMLLIDSTLLTLLSDDVDCAALLAWMLGQSKI
jgi:hypothetical protein